MNPPPLIGIAPEDLDARLERAVERVLERTGAFRSRRPDGRTAEAHRPDKTFLTNAEAQAYLGVSKPTLQRYRSSGRLRFSKIGGCVWYRREDLDALLASAEQAADASPAADDSSAARLP